MFLALAARGRRRFRKLKRASRLKLFLVLVVELLLLLAGALSRSPSAPSARSPLSMSHSGDDAPLHSLRGPSTGEMRPKSDSDTVLGRSRLQGLDRGGGEDVEEDEDGVGDGEAEEDMQEEVEEEEEEELAKGQGERTSWGLLGDEPRLQVERVSESSSDMMLPPPSGSSSKHTEAMDIPSESILKLEMSSPETLSPSAPTPRSRGPMAEFRRRSWISSEIISKFLRAVLYSPLA